MSASIALMKDRQCRMLPHQTVNAPVSKGGAGGQYTWGTPMDVQDFVPTGGHPTSVQVQAAQPMTYMMPAQPMAVSITDQSQFPTLGAAPVVTQSARSWGPVGGYVGAQPNVMAPQIVQTVAPIRQAVDFGPTRPRNTFAKRPVIASSLQMTQPIAIDWSQAGTGAIAQAIQAMPNTAHTSPYVTTAPAIPLAQLRAQPAVQYQQPSRTAGYVQQAHAGMHRNVLQAPRGR